MIEEVRGKLLDLKLKLFPKLSEALSKRDPKRLWESCLSTMTKCLTWNDVEFLLTADHWYRSNCILPGEIVSGSRQQYAGFAQGYRNGIWLNGGFSDLLWLIGLCEEELRVGRGTKVRRALIRRFGETHEVETECDLFDWIINAPFAKANYFHYFNTQDQGAVDSALKLFLTCEEQRKIFWTEFQKRVNEALQNEFDEEITKAVTIRGKVKRKFRHQFAADVGNFIDYYKTHIEEGGKSHTFRFPLKAEERKKQFIHRLQRDEKAWQVSFEGQNAVFKTDMDGFHHIHFLITQKIRYGKTYFLAGEVEKALKGEPSPEKEWIEGLSKDTIHPDDKDHEEEAEKKGRGEYPVQTGRGGQQKIGVKFTGKDAKEREWQEAVEQRKMWVQIRNIEIAMAHLEQTEDEKKNAEYERLKDIHRQLVGYRRYGKGGKAKPFLKGQDKFQELPKEFELCRGRVGRAITGATDKIRTELPALADHLERYLHKGLILTYDPPYRERWDL